MTHKPHIIALLLAAASLLALTAACNDNGDDDPTAGLGNFRYDVVTYDGYADGNASFTYLSAGDGPSVSLQGPLKSEPKLTGGQRVLLNYVPQSQKQGALTPATQQVRINGISTINNDSLRYADKARIDTVVRQAIRLESLWRTGAYINLRGQVLYTGKPRQFYLLMDKATWHTRKVQCYLVNNPQGAGTYHWRTFYASFYVGAAWRLNTCQELVMNINDVISPERTSYSFTKTQ